MYKYDVVILTDSRYDNPKNINQYIQNVLDEDMMVIEALQKKSLKAYRTNWDDPTFDWKSTKSVLFRSTWDYFDRYDEFSKWLEKISQLTQLVNPIELIRWNLDKHYLLDLKNHGINIPPTLFIEVKDQRSLQELVYQSGWEQLILKPAISGAARHTYKLNRENIQKHEAIFSELISQESMLLQEFQQKVIPEGEIAFMCFGGKYSHAVLKKAKAGDFRVQDDFGGTIHDYQADAEGIAFVERVISVCKPSPVYARVDVIRDNQDKLCVIELELIEPELWFRKYPPAADMLAEVFLQYYSRLK